MMTAKERLDARRAEFAQALLRHQTEIFGFIYSIVRNFDDADDLFQQTSLVLWRKYDQFDASRSFVAWACGVARFEVANFVRDRERHRLYFSDELNEILIDAHEAREREALEEYRAALSFCVKKLRERDQELLHACYGGSFAIREVARNWGRSIQSIHNSLSRIRRALHECVERALVGGTSG
jgi:RNA polymerase sigma-70 factor, ECF subfamily